MTNELHAPFPAKNHKYRVMNLTKKKDKASVAFYIDARDVMDRLDAYTDKWMDEYKVLDVTGNHWTVQCTLTVDGVVREDVGDGDAAKDAYSDALKRAAVKFGVGRYLYGMDTGTWFPVDEWKNFTPESVKRIQALLDKNMKAIQGGKTPAPAQPEPGNPFEEAEAPQVDGITPGQLKALHAVGTAYYGDGWDDKRHKLASVISHKRTDSSAKLTKAEASRLIDGIQRNINAAPEPAPLPEPQDDGPTMEEMQTMEEIPF